MKVIEDATDFRGVTVIIFKSASIAQIHEWLYFHYYGYKFAIIFDETKDEFESIKDAYVYFLDEALDEAADYAGMEVVKKQ